MNFCFDWKGIVHQEFVPRDQKVNKQFFQEILARLRDAVRRKGPELWENQTWILSCDISVVLDIIRWYRKYSRNATNKVV